MKLIKRRKRFSKVIPKVFTKLNPPFNAIAAVSPDIASTGSPLEHHPNWTLVGGDDPSHMGWKEHGRILTGEVVSVVDGSMLMFGSFTSIDAKIKMTMLNVTGGGNYTTACIRAIGPDNYIGVRPRGAVWEVIQRVGGAYTTIISATPAPVVGDVVEMSIVGDKVFLNVNGVLLAEATTTLAQNTGNVGIFEHNRTYAGDWAEDLSFMSLDNVITYKGIPVTLNGVAVTI